MKVFVVSPSSLASAFTFYKFVKLPAETITGKVAISKKRLEELTAELMTLDAIHAAIGALDFNKASPTDLIQILFAGALGGPCVGYPYRSGRKESEDPFPRGRASARYL